MNIERIFMISREISRENPKIMGFPGNFPEKTENHGFSREFSRENPKIMDFPGKFPAWNTFYRGVIVEYIVPVNQNPTHFHTSASLCE